MPLFRRTRGRDEGSSNSNSNEGEVEAKKEKGAWKRPANTAFKQQRLKAWQPILTPKNVLPTFFIIAVLFAPIGALLIWGSGLVTQITLDYSQCESLSPSPSSSDLTFFDMPSYKYDFDSSHSHTVIPPPQYAFVNNSDDATCFIRFNVPYDLATPVLLYYQLTNFYQNHRRYVKSLDTDQLKGEVVTASGISDCSPLQIIDGKIIYPCGLIANSLFNDTISNLTLLDTPGGSAPNSSYNFSYNGIAWGGEAKKYADLPGNNLSDLVPPPGWQKRYGPTWNESNIPNLREDQHFQNWMRTAALPSFSKLYGRNDDDTLAAGTYEIAIGLNFPVLTYHGTKSVIISTISWIGGKNAFLGWAYVAAASLFMLLAVAGTARHLIKPRRLGDMNLLSWNQQ